MSRPVSEFSGDFLPGSESGNILIEEAIDRYYAEGTRGSLIGVLDSILQRCRDDGHFLIPVIPLEATSEDIITGSKAEGVGDPAQEDLSFEMRTIETQDGKIWLAAFTSLEECEKGQRTSIVSHFIDSILEGCADMTEEGILINPWGQSFLLTKDLIRLILAVKSGS